MASLVTFPIGVVMYFHSLQLSGKHDIGHGSKLRPAPNHRGITRV